MMARKGNEMKIDLAVYTAINGYDWQPGANYSASDLVRYKRGIGRLPDPLMEAIPFGGVFNDDDTVVFYRYHMAIKSDSRGRDSLYLVLGTLPKSEVGKVNFKHLFALSEFAKPQKPAPVQTTYVGTTATGTPPDFSASFRKTLRGCNTLSEIGAWFSRVTDGTLSMRISGTYAEPLIQVQYEKPHAEERKDISFGMSETIRPATMPARSAGFSEFEADFRAMARRPGSSTPPHAQNVLLPVLIALLTGGIAGWYARGAKDWIAEKTWSKQSPPPETLSARLSDDSAPQQQSAVGTAPTFPQDLQAPAGRQDNARPARCRLCNGTGVFENRTQQKREKCPECDGQGRPLLHPPQKNSAIAPLENATVPGKTADENP